MSFIRISFILLLLFSKMSLSLIYEVSILTLKDGRVLVLLGDDHNLGTFGKNLRQAYLTYDLILKFGKLNPNKSIKILLESILYVPKGFTTDELNKMSSLEPDGCFCEMCRDKLIMGSKVGSSFNLKGIYYEHLDPNWIGFDRISLIPLLEKLLSLPKVSILSLDPRHSLRCTEDTNVQLSIFDAVGFLGDFVKRYWYDEWKKDIPYEYQDYFYANFVSLPKNLIYITINKISKYLNMKEEDIFFTPFDMLSPIQKKYLEENVVVPRMNFFSEYQEVEMTFDAELLHQILSKKNDDIIFAFIGKGHVERIIKALNDLSLIEEIHSATFFGDSVAFDAPIKFATIRLGIEIDVNSTVSDLLIDISEMFKLKSLGFRYEQAKSNIISRLKNLYKINANPRDEKGYSLLGYLVDYEESFLSEEYEKYFLKDIAYELIEMALEAGADPNVVEPDGKTPLIRVLRNMEIDLDSRKDLKILEMLLAYGANTLNPMVYILLKNLKNITKDEYPKILLGIELKREEKKYENNLKRKYNKINDDRIRKLSKYDE